MKKKVISTVLCAAMVASMFAGCGNKAANNSTADNSAADNAAESRRCSCRDRGSISFR